MLNKTRPYLIILLAVILFVSACAGPGKLSRQDRLRSELQKWESFDSQGVVEVSYLGLALRKMFSLSKNHAQLRFDIIEGGVMGAGAQPLLSFYLGDYVAFKSPYIPMLELLNISDYLPLESLSLFSHTDSLVARYGDEIIDQKKLTTDGVTIYFTSDYKLDKVIDPATKMELSATYGSGGKLSEINLKGTDNLSLKFSFDSLEYTEPQITALPRPTKNMITDALTEFQGLDLKALLKQFLQNKQER